MDEESKLNNLFPQTRGGYEKIKDKGHAENVRWTEMQLYKKGEEWIYHAIYLQATEEDSIVGSLVDMKVHALKAAACCPFVKNALLERYISGELDFSEEVFVDLPIDGRVLKCIVEYIYIGTMTLDLTLVSETLEACSNLNLEAAKLLIADYLTPLINMDNALRIFVAAQKYECLDLEQAAGTFVEQNFRSITTTQDWELLTESQLREVLCRDNLVVDSEGDVVRALLAWAAYKADELPEGHDPNEPPPRKAAFERLMHDRKAVRLPYNADNGQVPQTRRVRPKSTVTKALQRMSTRALKLIVTSGSGRGSFQGPKS